MIEEQGYVIRTDGPYAWVRTERKSTCGQCAANKGCGSHVFSKVLGNKLVEFKAINAIDVQAGDMVVLGLQESVLLKSALLMYLLPLLTMLIFAFMTQFLGSSAGLTVSQGWIALAGIAGLLGGFFYIRFFARRHQADSRYQPVILRRVTFAEQFTFNHPQKV